MLFLDDDDDGASLGTVMAEAALEDIELLRRARSMYFQSPEHERHYVLIAAGMESAQHLENAVLESAGSWIDSLKARLYAHKEVAAATAGAATTAAAGWKAFATSSQGRSLIADADAIMKSPAGQEAMKQLHDPKHFSFMSRAKRFFGIGKDLTGLVHTSGVMRNAGHSLIKRGRVIAVIGLLAGIGVALSSKLIKSTPQAVDQILKLPLPNNEASYNAYVQKVTEIAHANSYITIEGYAVSDMATAHPSPDDVSEKLSSLSALGDALKGMPDRLAHLANTPEAKTEYGMKALHFTMSYVEKLLQSARATTHMAAATSRTLGDYGHE